MRAPCSNRLELFEPYRNQGETDDQRSERLTLALSVCSHCPLKLKEECLDRGQSQDLARGVWGGKVITELDRKEEK